MNKIIIYSSAALAVVLAVLAGYVVTHRESRLDGRVTVPEHKELSVATTSSSAVATTSLVAKSTVDTSNWVTYRDEQWGYSFRHPKEAGVRADGYRIVHINLDKAVGMSSEVIEKFNSEISEDDKLDVNSIIEIDVFPWKINNSKHETIKDWSSTEISDPIKRNDFSDVRGCKTDNFSTCEMKEEWLGVPVLEYESDLGIGGAKYETPVYHYVNGQYTFINPKRPDVYYQVRFKLPSAHYSEEERAHPYYPYIEKSGPITKAILDSFEFFTIATSSTSTQK